MQFPCRAANGSVTCADQNILCNGRQDCADGADEDANFCRTFYSFIETEKENVNACVLKQNATLSTVGRVRMAMAAFLPTVENSVMARLSVQMEVMRAIRSAVGS
jgi:hypothetical protein